MARLSRRGRRMGFAAAAAVMLLTLLPAGQAFGFGSPEDFPGVPEVNAGGYMSCGVRADNTASCWGDNVSEGPGQSQPPAGVKFIEVNAGYAVGCGVKIDQTLACWGNNNNGQANPPAGTFLHVVPSFQMACGLRTDRTVACWGKNENGSTVPPAGQFKQLTVGIRYACGLRDDGTVECWGDNTYFQTTVPAGLNAKYLTTGNFTTCAIRTSDSTVVCWGRNNGPQVTTVPAGAFTTVNAGFAHVCGLRPDQTITCWGRNAELEATPPAGTFKQVSAGTFHSCGLQTDNTVVCWGYNGSSNPANADGRRTPLIRNAPPGSMVGVPYSFTFSTTFLSPAGTFTLAPGSGALPPGLTLNPDGTITGRPTTPGTFPGITVQMSNGFAPTATTTFSITISPFEGPTFTRTLTGDVVGPITVASGESVQIANARVEGPVTVNPGGALTVVSSQVARGITANAPSFLSICGTSVSGPSPAQALGVTNASVPVRIGDPANGCAGNRFAGDVTIGANSGGVILGGNIVSGSLNVNNNGPGGTLITANRVFQTLGCVGNNPAPTNGGQPNTAGTETGQCTGL